MDIVDAVFNTENVLIPGCHVLRLSDFRRACQLNRYTDYRACSLCHRDYDEDSQLALFVHFEGAIPHHFHIMCVRDHFRPAMLEKKPMYCPVCNCRLIKKCTDKLWDMSGNVAREYELIELLRVLDQEETERVARYKENLWLVHTQRQEIEARRTLVETTMADARAANSEAILAFERDMVRLDRGELILYAGE